MMLQQYIEERFLPKRAQAGISKNTVTTYRRRVARFCEVLEAAVLIGEIDRPMLDRFEKEYVDEGGSGVGAKNIVGTVRRIVRDWNPERYLAGSLNPRRSGLFRHSSEPSTLDHAFVTRRRRGCRIRSRRTVRQYGETIKLFGEFLGRPACRSDLCRQCVAGFLEWLTEARHSTNWTITNHAQRLDALTHLASDKA
jgi:hypothetical protein